MKIVVCIKQVPETADVRINPETNTLIREGVQSMINPFDEYAIEEALRLKEKVGGEVIVITMAPPQGVEALKEAVSLGVDSAILVSDRAFAGSDTWATSYALSCAIKHIGDVDLVLCGKQAVDGDTAQVGPGIAQFLGFPYVAFVRKVDEVTSEKMVVERMMEDGSAKVELPLPALLTVVKEINTPRLPSLRGKMKAKKIEIPTWSAEEIKADVDELGLKGSPTQVVKIFTPPKRGKGEMLEGEPDVVAEELFSKLRKDSIL